MGASRGSVDVAGRGGPKRSSSSSSSSRGQHQQQQQQQQQQHASSRTATTSPETMERRGSSAHSDSTVGSAAVETAPPLILPLTFGRHETVQQMVQLMQIGGVVLLSACGTAAMAGTLQRWAGTLGLARRLGQAMWGMSGVCMVLSLLSLWWIIQEMGACLAEWDEVRASKRDAKGQRERRRRAGSAPSHELQVFLASYRRAEATTAQFASRNGLSLLASIILFASLDVLVAVLHLVPPWWAVFAIGSGSVLSARALLDMGRLTDALTNQRESILYFHARVLFPSLLLPDRCPPPSLLTSCCLRLQCP